MRFFAAATIAVCLGRATTAAGEVALFPEEQEIVLACAITQAPRLADVPVLRSESEREATKGTYHYRLWLPRGYHAVPARRWPCIFIDSPGGDARMGNMSARLKSGGYIVVMLVESKNGPWSVSVGNFLAAHDDVVKRFRVREGWKIATGFSGGARGSALYAQLRDGFAGIVMQGAGAPEKRGGGFQLGSLPAAGPPYVAMIMGELDSLRPEATEMQRRIDREKFLLLYFNGGHDWAPATLFAEALNWLEQKAGYSTATSR